MSDAEHDQHPAEDATPTAAGMYDYYLGGTSNTAADREAAQRIIEKVPEIRDTAWANRGFLNRVVRWLAADQGIRPYPGAAPEVTFVGLWGCEDPEAADTDGSRWFYAAVARKPEATR